MLSVLTVGLAAAPAIADSEDMNDPDRDRSTESLEREIREIEGLYGKKDARLIEPLKELASVLDQDLYKKKTVLRRALKIVRENFGGKSAEYAEINLAVGIATIPGNPRGALPFFKRAYKIYNILYGDSDYRKGEAAYWIGRYHERFSSKAVEVRFLEAIRIFENFSPPDSTLNMRAHLGLVLFYERNGRSEKATPHCRAVGLLRAQMSLGGPHLIFGNSPVVPNSARHKDGYVGLEYTVTEGGTVSDIVVVESWGSPKFIDSAIDAVSRYRYAPAVKDGQIIKTDGLTNFIRFGNGH